MVCAYGDPYGRRSNELSKSVITCADTRKARWEEAAEVRRGMVPC